MTFAKVSAKKQQENGELAERLNAPDLKSDEGREFLPGFESLTLRQLKKQRPSGAVFLTLRKPDENPGTKGKKVNMSLICRHCFKDYQIIFCIRNNKKPPLAGRLFDIKVTDYQSVSA